MKKAVVVCTALALASGCKASVSANAKTGESEEVNDFDRPIEPDMMTADQDESAPPPGETPLYGARHDLAYRGPATTKCRCLAVALGQARDPAFEWATEPPATNPDTQFTVAMSSEKDCPGAGPDGLGASYWGYRVSGDDIVVVVENAVAGRPITTGAIIPKPVGDGQVYVRPLNDRVPYGRALDGAAQCKLGNPGAKRVRVDPSSAGGGLRIGKEPAALPESSE